MKTLDRDPVFRMGEVAVTPGAADELTFDEILVGLIRHLQGDWGRLCAADCAANEQALLNGHRVMSEFVSGEGRKYWVITEHDRSVTTILLPSEY